MDIIMTSLLMNGDIIIPSLIMVGFFALIVYGNVKERSDNQRKEKTGEEE